MSVKAVINALSGVFFNGDTDANNAADLQDVISDVTFTITNVVDGAAGTDYTYWSLVAPFAFQVVDAKVGPGAALTAADATANTYTLAKADGLGGSATSIATLVTTLAGGSWVADVIKSFTITPANSFVARGQLVTLKKTHLSTGTVTPQSTFTIKVRKV